MAEENVEGLRLAVARAVFRALPIEARLAVSSSFDPEAAGTPTLLPEPWLKIADEIVAEAAAAFERLRRG